MSTDAPEGKASATNRLKKEGRWEEAEAYKEAERKRLKDLGWTRNEAGDEAWRAMIEAFPPLPKAVPAAAVPVEVPPELLENTGEGDAREAVTWVMNNLFAYNALEGDQAKRNELMAKAPSGTARGFMLWAAGDGQQAFFSQVVPKYTVKAENETAKVFADDRRKLFKLLDDFEAWHAERKAQAAT